jgi:hypothetical protein
MANRWSTKVTADVNFGIAKGRRPTGKGSRQTTYQNIFRTRREEMLGVSRSIVAVFRNANTRSHAEVSTAAKWYLSTTAKGVSTNNTHFQYFSKVLRERGISDALPMLVEFVAYMLSNHEFTQVIGDDVLSIKEAKTMAAAAQDSREVSEDQGGWGQGAAAQSASIPSSWDMGDAASFSEEEDEME